MNLEFEKFVVTQKVIIFRNECCLISECASRPGIWDLAGGRIHKNEKYGVALTREIKEETGMDLKRFDLLDYKIFDWETGTKSLVHLCAIFLTTREESGIEIRLSEEHLQYKWISKNEIDNYKFLWDFMPEVIKKAFERYGK